MSVVKRTKTSMQTAACIDAYTRKPATLVDAKLAKRNAPSTAVTAAHAHNNTIPTTTQAVAQISLKPMSSQTEPEGTEGKKLSDTSNPLAPIGEYDGTLHPALKVQETADLANELGNLNESDDPISIEQDEAALAESHAIFEAELLPHIRSLYHFAYRLTSDEDEANDLVQDTYMKAFRFIKSYESGSNAKAWLFRILKNSFINNYRKVSKEPNKIDYEEAENYLNAGRAAVYSDTIDMRDKMFRGLIGDEVSHALNTLPVDFRTVIILCDIEEFTYEEIAKIIDIPIGTVRSRLHRARKMLREMLIEYAVSLGYDTDE
jgi:RNA polymerase sigma-70 factor (ECF subfamily)